MSFRFYALSAALLVTAPVQLAAQDAAGASEGANDGTIVVEGEHDDPSLDKVVCKTSKVIGSRLSQTKQCKTKRQWQAEKAQSRQQIEKAQNYKWSNN